MWPLEGRLWGGPRGDRSCSYQQVALGAFGSRSWCVGSERMQNDGRYLPRVIHRGQPCALVCKDPPPLCGWPSYKHKERESLPSPAPTWPGCVSLEWPEKLQCPWDTDTPDHPEPLIQTHRPILPPQPLLRVSAGRHHWMHLLGPRPTVCIPFPVPTRTGESVPDSCGVPQTPPPQLFLVPHSLYAPHGTCMNTS